MKCPKCGQLYCMEKIKGENALYAVYYCHNCHSEWIKEKSKQLTYKFPKEIEERKNQILTKLQKDYWIDLQIDIYEFEKGSPI